MKALSALLTMLCASTFYADVVFYKARRTMDFPGILRAGAWNPAELFYQAHEADLLTRKWAYEPRGEDLLLRALQTSRKALGRHPASIQARHMVLQNLLLLAQTRPYFLPEAHAAAEDLVRHDPCLNYRFKVVKYPNSVKER